MNGGRYPPPSRSRSSTIDAPAHTPATLGTPTKTTRLTRTLILGWLLLASLAAAAQKKNANLVYHLHHATSTPVIDGVVGESEWAGAEVATHFKMVLPMDTSYAKAPTLVRMVYDETNIYLSAVCVKPVPGPYTVESLRRDFSFLRNDNFILFLDPYDDQLNGFAFGTNAAGAQWVAVPFWGPVSKQFHAPIEHARHH